MSKAVNNKSPAHLCTTDNKLLSRSDCVTLWRDLWLVKACVPLGRRMLRENKRYRQRRQSALCDGALPECCLIFLSDPRRASPAKHLTTKSVTDSRTKSKYQATAERLSANITPMASLFSQLYMVCAQAVAKGMMHISSRFPEIKGTVTCVQEADGWVYMTCLSAESLQYGNTCLRRAPRVRKHPTKTSCLFSEQGAEQICFKMRHSSFVP